LQDKEYRDLLLTTAVILALGSTAYHYIEGWSWVDSLYFSVITLTTIRYGDFSPVTDALEAVTDVQLIGNEGLTQYQLSPTRKEFKELLKTELVFEECDYFYRVLDKMAL